MADRWDKAVLVFELRNRPSRARAILLEVARTLSEMATRQGWHPDSYRVYVEKADG